MAFVCLKDYEEKAAELVPPDSWNYFKYGACESTTVDLNSQCYKKLRLVPHCLRDVSRQDLCTSVLGFDLPMPVGLSPTGSVHMAHPEGELATARAAEKAGVIFTLSSYSGYSLEEVAAAAPSAIKWFQCYIYEDRSITEKLIRRAEEAGYKAIVVTIDSPKTRTSYPVMRRFVSGSVKPSSVRIGNFEGPLSSDYRLHVHNSSRTWDDGLKWLVELTNLPVIAKGILRAEDALNAIRVGCQGILVSNHGGRILDTTPATVE